MKTYFELLYQFINDIFSKFIQGLWSMTKTYFMFVGISFGIWMYACSIDKGEDINILFLANTFFIYLVICKSIYVLALLIKSDGSKSSESSELSDPLQKDSELETAKQYHQEIETNPDIRERICIHEAGHAIMFYVLGVNKIKVAIDCAQPHTKASISDSPVMTIEVLRKEVMVYYASIIAQRLLDKESSGFYGDNNSGADMKGANSCLHSILLIDNHELSLTGEDNQTKHEMSRLSKELYKQTEEILIEHIEELKELSRVLMRNGYADGHDIKKIFDDQQKRENVL